MTDSRPGERAGAGPPQGARSPPPRTPKTDARFTRAQQRLEYVRAMVKANSGIGVGQIAEAENISERQAQRILALLSK
ncbi:hypothetical protein [Actinacidiphila glaucinigra]|uniref:hypothetical protein n=1 Tax=Actinacidiphila glaucinigra TaxID=235986 RepID=UPI0035D8E05D